jgi:SAM-dependent methyltransferase
MLYVSMVGQRSQTGFDAAAARYDADELLNRVLQHMRSRGMAQLRYAFPPGAHLIEVGSGTGTEAAWLASEHGCQVALVDVWPRLLERATAKVRAACPTGLLGAHLLRAGAVGGLATIYGRGSFDGAYSSLGPLNCEPSLHPVAKGLAELVRPGGALVLSIMNRWCPVEMTWFGLHGQWREATRRWRGPVQASVYPGGPKDITTWYYSRREVERAFATDFRVEHVEALPLLWPPPYLDFLVTRFERFFRALEPLEWWAAQRPILRDLGDHVLLRMRRR